MQQIDATGYEADIIVTIQPTAPYTPVEALDAALDRLAQDADLEAVVSVSEAHGKHPFRLYSRTGERTFTPFFPAQAESYLQRQDRGVAYQFTGGFYARRRHLLEQWAGEGFALGRWEGVTVSKREGIDIDTPLDLLVAQAIGGQDE